MGGGESGIEWVVKVALRRYKVQENKPSGNTGEEQQNEEEREVRVVNKPSCF